MKFGYAWTSGEAPAPPEKRSPPAGNPAKNLNERLPAGAAIPRAALKGSVPMNGATNGLSWAATTEEWAEAAHFFARILAADPEYISHGEIQEGLSPDGKSWAPDLEEGFLAGLGSFGDYRGIAILRDEGGKIAAAASVTWPLESAGAPYATLQDMAVEPALRSQRLGARLLQFVEAEAARRGAMWIFLESGKNNRRAHSFFERQGFGEVSRVFMKPCVPKP
jgi:ribosomal protein S18 acetylase RimI-like enzyme